MSRRRIGELLVERGAITKEQLEAGLLHQQQTRQRLGITLIQMGVLTEIVLAQTLGKSLNLATVDLSQMKIEWAAVHMLRARFCEMHELFPFAIDGKGGTQKKLLVALSDPLNAPAIEEIEFTTGMKVSPYVSTHSQLRATILKYYHKDQKAVVDEEPPMVVGEEIISVPNAIPKSNALEAPPMLRPVLTTPANPKQKATNDLAFLFGSAGVEEDSLEKMEKQFWALMRILQRKGLVSREEFLKEFERRE
jgi:hypothetical protein